jgi:threonine synthase
LYQPTEIPRLPDGWVDWDYPASLTWSLTSFGAGNVADLVTEAAKRFSRPEVAPIASVGDRQVLELFWGPTLSFKDHAMQVLGRLLNREVDGQATILGATSGDTGSAAIEATRGRSNLRVVILFPHGMVTDFQRRQMTTVPDGNVSAIAVRGTFDDCQAMVKDAFAAHAALLAINSINWARIAAQAGYYINLGARMGSEFDVVIPTGNFGNAYACWLAKTMGVPIRQITVANNANHRLADLIATGSMSDVSVEPTVAPAMDIAVPSNLERFTGDPTAEFRSGWVNDDEIRATISEVNENHGYLLDPHSAAAWRVGESTHTDLPQVVVATAHPAKFSETVEQAVGAPAPLPPGFEAIMERDERTQVINAHASELEPFIR